MWSHRNSLTCAGSAGQAAQEKSTIAQALIDTYGLELCGCDESIAAHATFPGPDAPLLDAFRRMSMDERWLHRDAHTMLETFPWFVGERFDRIIDDLRAAPRSGLRIAEGFRLLPRLIRPWLDQPWQVVFLIPTEAFRRATLAARQPDQQFWRGTSSPDKALENLLKRDALFANTVRDQARQLNLHVITVDGLRSVNELAAEIARRFRLQGEPRNWRMPE